MNKYFKEMIIVFIQLIMFYVFPLFMRNVGPMGMVFIIIVMTFLLSVILGSISNRKVKYFYPIAIAILFIPSVFIYYNSSALIHAIWYLVVSIVGILVGFIIHKIR